MGGSVSKRNYTTHSNIELDAVRKLHLPVLNNGGFMVDFENNYTFSLHGRCGFPGNALWHSYR
jgi:hypothetical protein